MKINVFSVLFYTWLFILPFISHGEECELSKFKRLRRIDMEFIAVSHDKLITPLFYIEEKKYTQS